MFQVRYQAKHTKGNKEQEATAYKKDRRVLVEEANDYLTKFGTDQIYTRSLLRML